MGRLGRVNSHPAHQGAISAVGDASVARGAADLRNAANCIRGRIAGSGTADSWIISIAYGLVQVVVALRGRLWRPMAAKIAALVAPFVQLASRGEYRELAHVAVRYIFQKKSSDEQPVSALRRISRHARARHRRRRFPPRRLERHFAQQRSICFASSDAQAG